MTIVVVDEIDSLLGQRHQHVLYQLFDWPKKQGSRLVLLGIANAMDLTDRFLPQLKQRNAEPNVLIFKPYTPETLYDIVATRLREAAAPSQDASLSARSLLARYGGAAVPFFASAALEMCCRKVGLDTGDLRKAMDVCVQCLAALEAANKDVFTDLPVAATDSAAVAANDAVVVDMRLMSRTLTTVLGSSLVIDSIINAPKLQQLLLCVSSVVFGAHVAADSADAVAAAVNGDAKSRRAAAAATASAAASPPFSDLPKQTFQNMCKVVATELRVPSVTGGNFINVFEALVAGGMLGTPSMRRGSGGKRSHTPTPLNRAPSPASASSSALSSSSSSSLALPASAAAKKATASAAKPARYKNRRAGDDKYHLKVSCT
jgi:hypothetical protein